MSTFSGEDQADFSNGIQLREWLQSETTLNLSAQDDWPTPEASSMWQDFVKEFQANSNTTWRVTTKYLPVIWLQEYDPVSGSQVRIMNSDDGVTEVLANAGEKAGLLSARYKLLDTGIYNAVIAVDTDFLAVEFCGSGDNPFEEIDT